MEQMLLNRTSSRADDEELNAIFRCAHSVKGGAATFGFTDVAELTHQMETLLDKLRRHELAPTTAMVDVLLASGDALKAQLARHQGSGADRSTPPNCWPTIRALVDGGAPPAAGAGLRHAPAPAAAAARPATPAAAPALPAQARARWS
jgi:two-component system chemotaxis sensor kinase CheA